MVVMDQGVGEADQPGGTRQVPLDFFKHDRAAVESVARDHGAHDHRHGGEDRQPGRLSSRCGDGTWHEWRAGDVHGDCGQRW